MRQLSEALVYLDDLSEVLVYLDDLRKSGVTNMYGARPYLEEEFGFDAATAREVLQHWMDTFSTRHKLGENNG